jgi:hypothetical protein
MPAMHRPHWRRLVLVPSPPSRSTTKRSAIAPSPIAVATRLTGQPLTSPAPNTPGRLVSRTSRSAVARSVGIHRDAVGRSNGHGHQEAIAALNHGLSLAFWFSALFAVVGAVVVFFGMKGSGARADISREPAIEGAESAQDHTDFSPQQETNHLHVTDVWPRILPMYRRARPGARHKPAGPSPRRGVRDPHLAAWARSISHHKKFLDWSSIC